MPHDDYTDWLNAEQDEEHREQIARQILLQNGWTIKPEQKDA